MSCDRSTIACDHVRTEVKSLQSNRRAAGFHAVIKPLNPAHRWMHVFDEATPHGGKSPLEAIRLFTCQTEEAPTDFVCVAICSSRFARACIFSVRGNPSVSNTT